MREPSRLIAYVEFGHGYAKVHRLVEPSNSISEGAKLACGRKFRVRANVAGWYDFDESRSWMCDQCRRTTRRVG